ncbi:MAG: DUF1700 domain-containing protein [Lachnospiraceae bacterium]|nr:DUF1700 domain-containing protein [Lachnospiraceae bacterium]
MGREEFLQGLQSALSGNVPPAVVRDNLQYYQDYIGTEQQKGRTEAEIMEELGDPRLIARTIMDTTPGAEEGSYDEYRSGTGYYGGYAETSREGRSQTQAEDPQRTGNQGGIHYYDLNKWYWKLAGILLVVGIVILVITIVTGLLSLVIPLLPVIGLVILIMWFVQGPRR